MTAAHSQRLMAGLLANLVGQLVWRVVLPGGVL